MYFRALLPTNHTVNTRKITRNVRRLEFIENCCWDNDFGGLNNFGGCGNGKGREHSGGPGWSGGKSRCSSRSVRWSVHWVCGSKRDFALVHVDVKWHVNQVHASRMHECPYKSHMSCGHRSLAWLDMYLGYSQSPIKPCKMGREIIIEQRLELSLIITESGNFH